MPTYLKYGFLVWYFKADVSFVTAVTFAHVKRAKNVAWLFTFYIHSIDYLLTRKSYMYSLCEYERLLIIIYQYE